MMLLDEVSSEIVRRKIDDARFLAMWVANAERLAFVRMVRGDLAEAVEICAECETSLCALNCARANAENGNV